jgi:prepilin-type N-terminal cleavage/methylation domain-containing protein
MKKKAFTLIELLVVVAILGILMALILPTIAAAKAAARKAACISNLRQIGIAINLYSHDNDGLIPYGPQAPPFTSPADFYPSTGAPTSLLSLRNGAPVGLGLLLQRYLSNKPQVLFCPGRDAPIDAAAELVKVGANQAQGSYYYRHGGNTRLFDDPNEAGLPPHLRLDNLGFNRTNQPIRALVLDAQFLCPPDLQAFSVKPVTHHQRKFVDILYADGHSVSRPNRDNRFTVDVRDYAQLRDSFSHILEVLERADEVP